VAVVGAKSSEGLYFTDELTRAVLIISLPYPNLASMELKERLKFVSELGTHHKIGVLSTRDAGSDFYENLSMRTINQSIGKDALYDIVVTGRP